MRKRRAPRMSQNNIIIRNKNIRRVENMDK